MNEETLITEIKAGNQRAYERLFREQYARMCNYAFRMLTDKDDAEECVQSVFVALWERHTDLEINTSLKAYLYRAVHNNCLNRIKHNKVRQRHAEEMLWDDPSYRPTQSDALQHEDLERAIAVGIESLPSQCQTVFKMSRFDELSYAEIARELNISVNTVENHIVKALRLMRHSLQPFLPLLLWSIVLQQLYDFLL